MTIVAPKKRKTAPAKNDKKSDKKKQSDEKDKEATSKKKKNGTNKKDENKKSQNTKTSTSKQKKSSNVYRLGLQVKPVQSHLAVRLKLELIPKSLFAQVGRHRSIECTGNTIPGKCKEV